MLRSRFALLKAARRARLRREHRQHRDGTADPAKASSNAGIMPLIPD